MWPSLVVVMCLLGMATAAGRPYIPATTHTGGVASTSRQHTAHSSIASYQAQPRVEYNTEFFYFSAPEELSLPHPQQHHHSAARAKKNLQVVVIKAPENRGFERVAAELVHQYTAPTRTQIYVLNRKPNLQKHVQQAAAQRSPKPEVHFVQYHSTVEAPQVRQAIAQQYGGGGKRPVRDDTTSVLNFVDSGRQTARASNLDHALVVPSADSTPVDKNYARNFLPTGVDVVPGSSYIPLVVYRH